MWLNGHTTATARPTISDSGYGSEEPAVLGVGAIVAHDVVLTGRDLHRSGQVELRVGVAGKGAGVAVGPGGSHGSASSLPLM